MKNKALYILAALLIMGIAACKNKSANTNESTAKSGPVVYNGLYTFSPNVKSFKQCGHAHDYWVADSSAQLELQYSQLGVQPEQPVYVQVEGRKIKTAKDSTGGGYDSTLIVTKVVKITKEIPKDGCN